MRLDALNRLVIVDACQAESILVDPQVSAIQKWMESGLEGPEPHISWPHDGENPPEIEPFGPRPFHIHPAARDARGPVARRTENCLGPQAASRRRLQRRWYHHHRRAGRLCEGGPTSDRGSVPQAFRERIGDSNLECAIAGGAADTGTPGSKLDQSLRIQTAPCVVPAHPVEPNCCVKITMRYCPAFHRMGATAEQKGSGGKPRVERRKMPPGVGCSSSRSSGSPLSQTRPVCKARPKSCQPRQPPETRVSRPNRSIRVQPEYRPHSGLPWRQRT